MTIDVAIVDDESIARSRLRRLLSEQPDVRVVFECADAASAIDAIAEHRPDVVFLDIQMPGGDGFQVVRALPPDDMPLVVFVTAHESHAIRAFDANAIDYVLKPFGAERVAQTMKRVRAQARPVAERRALLAAVEELSQWRRQRPSDAVPADSTEPASAARYVDRFTIRHEGKVRFVRAADVDYIQSAANYVELHVGADRHLLRETLRDVEAALDPSVFVRIHRRTIVNISRVLEIQPWFSGDAVVTLVNREKLRMSRNFRSVMDQARFPRREG